MFTTHFHKTCWYLSFLFPQESVHRWRCLQQTSKLWNQSVLDLMMPCTLHAAKTSSCSCQKQHCKDLRQRLFFTLHSVKQCVSITWKPCVTQCNNSLTKLQEFILFLMKLRLNLHNVDLAFRFGASKATVSRIFDKRLHCAYCRLNTQIVWPERATIVISAKE